MSQLCFHTVTFLNITLNHKPTLNLFLVLHRSGSSWPCTPKEASLSQVSSTPHKDRTCQPLPHTHCSRALLAHIGLLPVLQRYFFHFSLLHLFSLKPFAFTVLLLPLYDTYSQASKTHNLFFFCQDTSQPSLLCKKKKHLCHPTEQHSSCIHFPELWWKMNKL